MRRLTVLGAGRWHAPLGRHGGPRVLAVCGQPGIGKSTVAANLAIALAGLRSRVVLVDLDLRRPAQHRLFGITSPVAGLRALLENDIDTIEQALTPTPVRNLFLVTSDATLPPVRPRPEQQRQLLQQIWELEADVVIADVAAAPADGEAAIDLFGPGALRLVVATPDARSIRSAYNFLRGQVARAIEHAAGDSPEVGALVAALARPSAPPMHEVLEPLRARPDLYAVVTQSLTAFGGHLIGNHARSADEADLLHATSRLVADYLGVNVPVLGIVEASQHLATTSCSGRPLLLGTGIDRNVRLFHGMAEQLLLDPPSLEDAAPSAEEPELLSAAVLLGAATPSVDAATPSASGRNQGEEEPPLPAPLGGYMRRFPRHSVDWHARYVSRQGRDIDVRVFDVSQGGVSIEAIPGVDLGDGGTLTFTQIAGQPAIEVSVKAARRPAGRVGLRFEGVPELAERLTAIARSAREDDAIPQAVAASS